MTSDENSCDPGNAPDRPEAPNSEAAHSPAPDEDRDRALAAIYDDFLRKAEQGELIDVEVLCRAHPQFARELMELHERQETVVAPESKASEAIDEVQAALTGGERGATPHYVIRGKLAQGGMGIIFKVWDSILHRDLAMKLIRRKEAPQGEAVSTAIDPRTLARFLREAEITARLDHPGVVPIHERGTDDRGRTYFTMRLVKGQRLDAVYELVRQGRDRWTQTRVLDVIVMVCETVAFAHSRGIIHRDLKPSNIMVGLFGETYVMDWGLAKRIRDPDDSETFPPPPAGPLEADSAEPDSVELGAETNAGVVLGTASYMPPEQARGSVEELDERSDVYSVGALLYELLAGQPPYRPAETRRDSRKIVQAVLQGPPVPIAELNARVPAELVAICERAMARKKEDRYQSMQAMAEDLRAYLENRVVGAYQSGALAELKKWVRRNRGVAIASAAALAAAIIGMAAVVGVQRAANDELSRAKSSIEESYQSEQLARATAVEQRRRAEGLLLARQSTDVRDANPRQALLLAIESERQFPSAAADNAMLAAVASPLEREILFGHRGPIQFAAVSPNGERAATASDDNTAIVWDVRTGAQIAVLIGHRAYVARVLFSPDGRRVATGACDNTAAIWDVDSGRRIATLAHEGWVNNLAFSPDGRLLATASNDETVRLWDSASGASKHVLRTPSEAVWAVAFSPDGSRVATGTSAGKVRIWDAAGGQKLQELEGHTEGVGTIAFDSSGRNLLSGRSRLREAPVPDARGDTTVRIWDSDSGQIKHVLEHSAAVAAAAFSHAGDFVVTATRDGAICKWNATTGQKEYSLQSRIGPLLSVAISSDDRLIAGGGAGGTACLWRTDTLAPAGRLAGHADAVTAIAFCAGERVLTASRDRTARVWNMRTPWTADVSNEEPLRDGQLRIDPQSRFLIAYSAASRFCRLFRFPDAELVAELPHESRVTDARFSRDGTCLATRTESGTVRAWSASDGALRAELEETGQATEMTFTEDGNLVVVAMPDRVLTVWDQRTWKRTLRQKLAGMKYVQTSPDGRYLLAWSASSGKAELWSTLRGERVETLSENASSRRWNATFGSAGETLVTWGPDDRSARLWQTRTASRPVELIDSGRPIRRCVFSTDGNWCATVAGISSVCVWDAAAGRLRTSLRAREPSIGTVTVGPGAERLITGSGDGVTRLWNGRTGDSVVLIGERIGDRKVRISRAGFTADGTAFLTETSDRDEISVWDSGNGERRIVLRNDGGTFSDALFSGDGQWLATLASDGTVRCWPLRPGQFLARFPVPGFVPDEREFFQIGTAEERAALRMSWNAEFSARMLCWLAQVRSPTAEDARDVRESAQRELQELVDSLGPAASRSQLAQEYERALRTVEERCHPSPPLLAAFASALAEAEDFIAAERLARAVLEQFEFCDVSDWRFWLSCALGPAKRAPRELLAEFPNSTTAAADDARWLLRTLAGGDPIRIHAGGDALQTADGALWQQDCFFGGGHLFGEAFGSSEPSGEPIRNTDDPTLYQTERWFDRDRPAIERSYLIPLPPGSYRVVLHFAEIYFQPPDRRVFDVLAEDRLAIEAYDTLAKGFATADTQSFETRVDDGLLNLEFRSIVENPKVSGLVITRVAD